MSTKSSNAPYAPKLVDGYYSFECPNQKCRVMFYVHQSEIQCGLFRCLQYKSHNHTRLFVNPHLTDAQTAQLLASGSVFGCGQQMNVVVRQ